MMLSFLIAALVLSIASSSMPPPFSREISVGVDPGNDVLIMQTLLMRDPAVSGTFAKASPSCDESCGKAISQFQDAYPDRLPSPQASVLDEDTAGLLLELHSADGFRDSGFTARSMGYKYKIHIPVHSNRSVETTATLFDADGGVVLTFRARTHGHRGDGTENSWPDFGDGDIGLSQFASGGNTVTGLAEIDLNSPEPNPDMYGPWPVNRIVRGLDGNALLLLPSIRDGLLLHTGNWTVDGVPWDPDTMNMPNSSGCIHAPPDAVEAIYLALVNKLGVTVNNNTFSGKNYPYKCQGIVAIELVD